LKIKTVENLFIKTLSNKKLAGSH
jgi:hypothetical protein